MPSVLGGTRQRVSAIWPCAAAERPRRFAQWLSSHTKYRQQALRDQSCGPWFGSQKLSPLFPVCSGQSLEALSRSG